jgi:hypothetical protein
VDHPLGQQKRPRPKGGNLMKKSLQSSQSKQFWGKERHGILKRRAIIRSMNMIVCDKNCRHQQEGYCGLNQITSLKATTNTKCGYYEARSAGKSAKTVTSSKAQAPAQFR